LEGDWKDPVGGSLLPSQGFVADLKLSVTCGSPLVEPELAPEDDPNSQWALVDGGIEVDSDFSHLWAIYSSNLLASL
jgi:hypothetical protein